MVNQNEERRQAQRQKRGALRVEEILHVAGALFAERGYDKVTMNMIATQADTSPGSLYQFFPNKEALTLEFAAMATRQLDRVYDTMAAPEVLALPFPTFLDAFIDRLISFNRNCPGFLALELGATLSPSLTAVLATLQHGTQARLDAMVAAYWPQSTREQRQLPLLVSYRLFLVLLPLVIQGDGEQQQAIVREMQMMLHRYWEPILALFDGMAHQPMS